MKRTSALFLAGLVLIGLVILVSNQGSEKWTLNKFNSQKIDWKSCYQKFECGSFLVPVDYKDLKAGTFRLQVLRHLATNKKKRIGSIVVNPGGPGGSGIDYAFSADSIVSKELNSRFDLVGFDGRGIGSSEPIRCLTDSEEDRYINIDGDASTPNQMKLLKDTAFGFAQSCFKSAGQKLGHISTYETAQDMEVLRHLLGEKKLNFLGKSYGTYLGAIYISLYPQSVGRFVLDGAIDPNISIRDQSLTQAKSFENSLNSYLSKYQEFSKTEIQKFIFDSGVKPLETLQNRKLTRSLLITAIAASLYDNVSGWKDLSVGLHNAIKNKNPDQLFLLADDYNNRDTVGHFINNQNDIGIAINCIDWSSRRSFDEIKADVPNFIKASTTFGRYIAFSDLPCTYWKFPAIQPALPFKKIKSKPFLIIGVTKDPATPHIWAQNLAKEFPNSRLLTLDGEGHTGHNRGNSCIDSKVDGFFLRGELPDQDLLCGISGN